MNLFSDIRNFINDNSFKIIICNNLIDIINYEELLDINSSLIKIKSNKEISITGKELNIIKMFDNEILIKGIIKDIRIDE